MVNPQIFQGWAIQPTLTKNAYCLFSTGAGKTCAAFKALKDEPTHAPTFVLGEFLEEVPRSARERVALLHVAFLHHLHAVDDDAEPAQTKHHDKRRAVLCLRFTSQCLQALQFNSNY